MSSRTAIWGLVCLLSGGSLSAQPKRPLTLDDLFSNTEIRSAKLAPDGRAAVIATSRPDWKRDRFRDDLWVWRQGHNELLPLAQSGHDSDPEWSPNGEYVAFLSSAPVMSEPASENESPAGRTDADKEISRVWVISTRSGGPAFPLYAENLKPHAFAWKADSSAIIFSTPEPLSKAEQETERREWKDVARWREQERGDLLVTVEVAVPPETEGEARRKPLPGLIPH